MYTKCVLVNFYNPVTLLRITKDCLKFLKILEWLRYLGLVKKKIQDDSGQFISIFNEISVDLFVMFFNFITNIVEEIFFEKLFF